MGELMTRRDQIRMTPQEITDFLRTSRTMILVSNGKDGFPHPIPMWYAVDEDNVVYMTTFKKSQKILNLQQDPRVALLVESGDVYAELKSVLIYSEVELVNDPEATRDIMIAAYRHQGALAGNPNPTISENILGTLPKRIGMKFTPDKIVSWDHSKLCGVY